MKKTKRIFTAICAASMLTAALPIQAAAIFDEGEPLAKTLEEMQQDSDAYFRKSLPGIYHYLTAEEFRAVDVARKTYIIQLEKDASLPEDAAEKLGKTIHKYNSTESVAVAEGAPEMEGYYANSVSLEDMGNGTYQLTLSKYHRADETALIAYLQTIPGFESVSYDVAGYEMTAIGNLGYDFWGSQTHPATEYKSTTLLVQTLEGTSLSIDDFDAALGVTDVSPYANNNTVYVLNDNCVVYEVKFDPTQYHIMTRSEMLQLVQRVADMEQVEAVDFACMINDLYYGINEPIDNGAIPYITRGDCDENETIDANDAYLALRHYAAGSVGSASVLSDRNRCAADINGNGKVDADDAYLMLKYYAAKSVGSDAQWSDILQ